MAIGAGALVGALGFYALVSSSNETPRANEKSVAKAETPPLPAPRQPVQSSLPPVPIPVPAAPAEAAPLPGLMRSSESTGDAHELTPKEEYELKLKRGEIKPAAAPAANPVAVKEIPASDQVWEAWKDIFNGKDLTGLHILHGTWTVEDGALTATPSGDFSRIKTNDQFGDFELKYKLMMVKGRHSEVQLREYSQVYDIEMESGVWKEVSVKAIGGSTSATMDGTALNLDPESANATNNDVICFYIPKGGSVKIKDISLRPAQALKWRPEPYNKSFWNRF